MSLSRTYLAKSVIPAVRALSTSAVVRAPGSSDGRQEGSTASSQGFSKREKAAEDQYVQNREREAYKKAHAELKAQREKMEKEGIDVDSLENEKK